MRASAAQRPRAAHARVLHGRAGADPAGGVGFRWAGLQDGRSVAPAPGGGSSFGTANTCEQIAGAPGLSIALVNAEWGALLNKLGSRALAVKRPVGVMVGMAPWNAATILGFRAVAMAVACCNTVVLKVSERDRRRHMLIGEVFRRAPFPKGAVNVFTDAAEVVNIPTGAVSSGWDAGPSHQAAQKGALALVLDKVQRAA